jgi:hypothetical protein
VVGAIPRGVEEITPTWLTGALRASGALQCGSVADLVITPFAEGVGLMSQLAKLEVSYTSGSWPTLPSRMVVKLSARRGPNRAMAVDFGLYEREVRFYKELAAGAGIRTPVPFVAVHDRATDDMVLVLEDVSPEEPAVAGFTDDEVALIVRQLAAFHAWWWDGAGRTRPDWVPALDGPVWSAHQSMFRSGWEAFARTPTAASHAEFMSFGTALVDAIPALQRRLSWPPVTLVHLDFRRSNIFVTHDRGAPQVAVVDWQPLSIGRGPYDLGYFLSQSVPVAQRRALEQPMLSLYHSVLRDHGVRDYTADDVWDDYRLGVAYSSSYAVGTLLVDLANSTGRSYADEILARAAAAVFDLDALAVVRRAVAA